ncbi:MAG: NAD-dependent protein deacylase [Lactobacillaceae bacterium]|jgi:NAD-dependent deacetylase|nr:NAD-dependent protein deacylase [Lactobacillaceae bacterium]
MITNEIQSLFDNAQKIVFLTGAGVSTASGIPDYWSKNGIYNGVTKSPEYLLSTQALKNEPEKMYQFMMENMYFPDAKPNIIHQKMASLTQSGQANIITQNVDQLDDKAGAKNVIYYHGSLYDIYGVKSHTQSNYDYYKDNMYLPDGEMLRPGITLYGEMPPYTKQAALEVHDADLIVIVGTSFVVYPFAALLNYANNTTPIISINLEQIPAPINVQQIIGDATEFFDELKI